MLEKKLPDNVQSSYGDAVFAYQIYLVRDGERTLYTPPVEPGSSNVRNVIYEKTGERVVPAGQTESSGFKKEYTIDGKTYENVYFLKPGEAMVIPVVDNSVQYYVREIGIDTDIYEEVRINGKEASITETDNTADANENLSPTHLAATDVSTVQNRGRVTYENIPKENHIHNLRLRKVVDSPVKDPDASFRFDVLLESSETGTLVPYSRGAYYIVKTDENGNDHYCAFENGQLVESDRPVEFHAGRSGSIDHIQEGYTILIKGLLAGTDFQVTENLSSSEMPDGYMYVGTETEHAGSPELEGSLGTIKVSTVQDGDQEVKKDALVEITNRPTGRIIVEKKWECGEFVEEHGDVYVALYRKTSSGGTQQLELVEGSARKLAYDTSSEKFRTEYPLPGQNLSDYLVREVNVTLDASGNIRSVDSYMKENAVITIEGETTLDSGNSTASDSYIVNYTQGEEASWTLPEGSTGTGGQTGRTRTDTVKNTLPAVSLYKTNSSTGDGKEYLSGAVFALEKEDGTAVTDGSGKAVTFTSDTHGIIIKDRYFSDGIYYLREASAPDGYLMLENRIMLTVQNGIVSARTELPGTTLFTDQLADNNTAFRFEIMNNPGVELPATGGPGTRPFTIIGISLILGALVLLWRRKDCEK